MQPRGVSRTLTSFPWSSTKPLACLESGPFALHLTDRELHSFAKIFRRKTVPAKTVLVKQGDEATDFIIIESGECSVYIVNDETQEHTFLAKKVPGEFIGEQVLVLEPDVPYKRSASVIAVETSKIMLCSRKDVHNFLKKNVNFKDIVEDVIVAKTKTLRNLQLLEGAVITDDILEQLSSLFRYVTIDPGKVLFSEGDQGSEMYAISEGKVEIYSKSKKEEDFGKEIVLDAFGPGQIFGEMAIVMHMPRSATAKAVEKTLLLQLNESDLMRFLAISPDLKHAFDKQVTQRVAYYLRRLDASFLRGFTDEQYQRMAEVCHVSKVTEGVGICHEGDDGTTFYMVVTGRLKVYKGVKHLSTLNPGDFFGEIALVQNIKRTATVITDCHSVLLSCEKEDFDNVFATMPWVVAEFQAHLAPDSMTLEHVIYHKTALKYFTMQLEKEFSSENLQFVQEVQQYKLIPDGDPKQMPAAIQLMEKFILPSAPVEINIPAKLASEIQEKLDAAKESAQQGMACKEAAQSKAGEGTDLNKAGEGEEQNIAEEDAEQKMAIDNTLFNQCLQHIIQLMATDSLQRFKQGKLFKEFVASLTKYTVD